MSDKLEQLTPVRVRRDANAIRVNCTGLPPLDAIIRPWMTEVANDPRLFDWISRFSSPLNLHSVSPFRSNIDSLRETARNFGVDFEVYFARKANKCLAYVEAAKECHAGIDVASLQELEQVLESSFPTEKVICTAAIKTAPLLRKCIESNVVVAIDNMDELSELISLSKTIGRTAVIAIRIGGFWHDGRKLYSRFGFDIDQLRDQILDRLKTCSHVNLKGIHFHLDGYDHRERVSAITQCIALIDTMTGEGHELQFLDIGGGIPMSYLSSPDQWSEFWSTLHKSLRSQSPPITYRNHGLGLQVHDDEVVGSPKTYPFYQTPVQSDWLRLILESEFQSSTIAAALTERGVSLHCEPGRSILDGCGMTVARVEFVKTHAQGYSLVGLHMNHTQCRTSSEDFLVDPIVVKAAKTESNVESRGALMEGFLVGAYCTESELLCKRKLKFPHGISIGDLVIFPNTAGYMMHFLESRSHQFPLAKNVLVAPDRSIQLDQIDVQS